ncbi:alpha/beta hydrolase [Clostridium sp. DJ247]|uniref:alpha/beta hydrolase n=1 Tax=Clostridium sp. DJ247 TaxID=2726188 RepID=UPI001629C01E|nr:alpha/beta hydrolase [Clostridium sp. DJ247]MBC2579101.1 alpha/beta hydrolase [Clostridium sp. DJ247]
MLSNEAKMVKKFLRSVDIWDNPLNEIRKSLKDMTSEAKFPEDTAAYIINAYGVNCELFIPLGAADDKIIVYFHGGGYCLGIWDANRKFVANIAKESGYKTLLVDYRLAPENPYPAAHEDALSVYKWLLRENFKPANIVLMGDSSGCGLILATLFKLKELQMQMPAALIFISPVVDYTGSGESLITAKEADPFQYEDPFSIANNFLCDNDVKDPFISPLYGDLRCLPPILIHASEHDVFLSDSINLADKAKDSGIDVHIKIWEELWHVFHINVGTIPESKEALEEICEFIDNRMNNF